MSATPAGRTDFVLVVPPCASAALPILGPSILASGARAAGLSVHVAYANLELAARVGYARYRRFALSCTRMHGEMLFAEAAWGTPLRWDERDFDAGDDAVTPADFEAALSQVPGFVEDVADEIAALRPRVVGFSSVFQQTVASVALARSIRARQPEVILILGGANASRPMAEGIVEATDVFDAVVAGEADLALPGLVRDLIDGGPPAERIVDVGPTDRLDAVPTPTFEDYFEQAAVRIAAGRLPEGLPLALPFESSRGCWWGERSHCTFCGLNGTWIAERAKSPTRILDEIEQLSERWGVTELRASDDLLPRRVQREVLPELARRQASRPRPLRFFYEVKSSMKRRELEEMAAAGVTLVQAGVESLSSETLRRIAKGTTGPMNLAFLRACRATGIDPLWNWMVGFPGDCREDYEATLRLIPMLEHLRPPVALAPVRIDRYSPYHTDPGSYGISGLQSLAGMERVWPEGAPIGRIAYHFDADMVSPFRSDAVLARRVDAALRSWLAAWEGDGGPPELSAEPAADGSWVVRDTRRVAVEPVRRLSAAAGELLLRLERPRPCEVVETEADPAAFADLLFRGFIAQHEGQLVSLVVRPTAAASAHCTDPVS